MAWIVEANLRLRGAEVPSGSPTIGSDAASNTPDPAARFRALFAAHYDFVWRMLRRLGVARDRADDAAQDVFVVAARRLRDIEIGKERSFLLGTTIRRAAEVRRREQFEKPASDDVLETVVDGAATPDEALDERRALALLDAILDAMDDELRAVLVLFELEGLTKSEMSEALGIPEGTVASRLRRARARFKALVVRHKKAPRGGRITP